jgi:hypothetical protein
MYYLTEKSGTNFISLCETCTAIYKFEDIRTQPEQKATEYWNPIGHRGRSSGTLSSRNVSVP